VESVVDETFGLPEHGVDVLLVDPRQLGDLILRSAMVVPKNENLPQSGRHGLQLFDDLREKLVPFVFSGSIV